MKKKLYPSIEPFASDYLKTEQGHDVYFEQAGNPAGIPVIFLHGGPGASCKPHHRCFFDPSKYHIVLMDQRGSGRSKPLGQLLDNSTHDLIADMEAIRCQLNIDSWLLFGGSWGATLALIYAQQYTDNVLGLILRGTFLARKVDADWFLKEGASRLYPAAWQRFVESVSASKQSDLVQLYHQRLASDDKVIQSEASREWDAWGGAVVLGDDFNAQLLEGDVSQTSIAQACIETYYASHQYFIDENQILDNIDGISHLPCQIIHGKRDYMCPVESSYSLAQAWPAAELTLLAKAGHLAHGEDMIDALVGATDSFAQSV